MECHDQHTFKNRILQLGRGSFRDQKLTFFVNRATVKYLTFQGLNNSTVAQSVSKVVCGETLSTLFYSTPLISVLKILHFLSCQLATKF